MIWRGPNGSVEYSENGRWSICYFPSPGIQDVSDMQAPAVERWANVDLPSAAAAKAYAEGVDSSDANTCAACDRPTTNDSAYWTHEPDAATLDRMLAAGDDVPAVRHEGGNPLCQTCTPAYVAWLASFTFTDTYGDDQP